MPRDLGRDLEHDELVRPGGEATQPTELIEPVQDVDECVVGGLLREVVKLRAADRSQLAAPARQLVYGDPLQHIMKAGDRLVVPRVPDPKLLDPLSRVRIERRLRSAATSAARARPLLITATGARGFASGSGHREMVPRRSRLVCTPRAHLRIPPSWYTTAGRSRRGRAIVSGASAGLRYSGLMWPNRRAASSSPS